MRFLPGGSLTFSAKLVSADSAFSQLLGVELCESVLETPTVLLQHILEDMDETAHSSCYNCQQLLFQQLSSVSLTNLPTSYTSSQVENEWIPQISSADHQSAESRAEQNQVLTQVLKSIRNRLSSPYLLYSNKNEIILGPPGSGKSHLSKIVLSCPL